ncbi:MAG: DedA family protein [Leptospirales bacterium]|nr:DedA family protein [Leptospirales bacterium]
MDLLNFILGLVQNVSGPVPYIVVFSVLLLCGFGLPLPEDVMLFTGGMLAYFGKADVHVMVVVAFAGVMIGDGTIFFLGSKFGLALTKKAFFARILSPERLNAVREQFHKHGNKIVFAARFMPGLRTPVFFTAGTLHLPFRVFLFYDGFAALISVPTIIYLVYAFGHEVEYIVGAIKSVEHGVIFLIVGVILVIAGKIYWNHRKEKKAASQNA